MLLPDRAEPCGFPRAAPPPAIVVWLVRTEPGLSICNGFAGPQFRVDRACIDLARCGATQEAKRPSAVGTAAPHRSFVRSSGLPMIASLGSFCTVAW